MSVPEVIGFAISLLSLIYLFFKNRSQGEEKKASSLQNENYREEDPLSDFLKAIGEEFKQKKPILPPSPIEQKRVMKKDKKQPLTLTHKEEYQSKRFTEQKKQESMPENDSIAVQFIRRREEKRISSIPLVMERAVVGRSRAKKILGQLKYTNQLVIFKEILDKPKSLRPWE
jgi:hypothetical protein